MHRKLQDNAKTQVEEVKAAKNFKDITVKIDTTTIEEVDESKQPCSLVLIGHRKAGKSTISGQILLLLGCVDEKTKYQYKKQAKDQGRDSQWIAGCMNVLEEEARGRTVEVDAPHSVLKVSNSPFLTHQALRYTFQIC